MHAGMSRWGSRWRVLYYAPAILCILWSHQTIAIDVDQLGELGRQAVAPKGSPLNVEGLLGE